MAIDGGNVEMLKSDLYDLKSPGVLKKRPADADLFILIN
jgi:hypothetical protein